MTRDRMRRWGGLAVAPWVVGLAASAQIPDMFENLEILPKDIAKRDLVQTMRGFCDALDVRCVHCHVGQPGGSLALNPQAASSHYRLGEAYRAAGDPEHARTSFERTLQLEPDNRRAQRRLEELEPKPSP